MPEEHELGLVLVTAPTGDGKTESARFAASLLGRTVGARGLNFALPTMGTADAMLPRVEAFAARALSGERALLLHAMAWLSSPGSGNGTATSDDPAGEGAMSAGRETAVEADGWLRGAKRGLLAPLGVGTIDQALSAVLPLRYNVLRLLGLPDMVFVVGDTPPPKGGGFSARAGKLPASLPTARPTYVVGVLHRLHRQRRPARPP